MASNSTLVKGAALTSFGLDATPGSIDAEDTIAGTAGADAYYFDNTRGGQSVGDKTFEDFGNNDSLLASTAIFDGNGDGFIVLGPNAVLDVERSSGRTAGSAQFNLVDQETGEAIYAARFLGTKGGTGVDGAYVYADASTLLNLINDANGAALDDSLLDANNGDLVNVIEGTVGDDDLVGTEGVDYFLYDTALGLNLGGDTITGFGREDRLVTTSAILNRNGDGFITFNTNELLDLPGATGGANSDPSQNPGGQIDFGGSPELLTILGSETIEGVTYYFYGYAESL